LPRDQTTTQKVRPAVQTGGCGCAQEAFGTVECAEAGGIPGAYGGKPVDLQFAAAILQQGYVGFYLMCLYMNQPMKKKISPALLKLLKGKTCFQLKAIDDGLKKDIDAALTASVK
jgi:hypothetical protein